MEPFSILGIEYELGENKIDIKDLYKNSERIIEKTGIKCVHETNLIAEELAYKASKKLLDKFSIDPDVLIYVTQSQKYILPGSGVLLHDRLKISKDCKIFDINAGCSGFVQGLIMASSMISSHKNILIVCADQYRDKLDPDDRSTKVVFSDGASAIMISSMPKIKISVLKSRIKGDYYHMLVQEKDGKNFICLVVNCGILQEKILFQILMKFWNILKKDLICDNIFIHQASKVVVDGIEKELINAPKLNRNYENRGNTVSSTIPILIKDKKIDINSINSILSGFGVGLMSYTIGIETL